jgi:hypothetical protein
MMSRLPNVAVRDRLDRWNTRMSPAEDNPELLKSERII